MKYLFFVIIIIIVCNSTLQAQESTQQTIRGYFPEDGFVPNDSTAIKIAEAVLIPIYGINILDMRPFVCELKNDSIWFVKGTIKDELQTGGVPYVQINKKTGEIIKLYHTR